MPPKKVIQQSYLPARTAVPTQESTPERNELNGKDPTVAMYATCYHHANQNRSESLHTLIQGNKPSRDNISTHS